VAFVRRGGVRSLSIWPSGLFGRLGCATASCTTAIMPRAATYCVRAQGANRAVARVAPRRVSLADGIAMLECLFRYAGVAVAAWVSCSSCAYVRVRQLETRVRKSESRDARCSGARLSDEALTRRLKVGSWKKLRTPLDPLDGSRGSC
jgi:hypothetical protein